MVCRLTMFVVLATALAPLRAQDSQRPLKVLFLGDNGHHRPADRFRQLEPVLASRGIELTYTDKVDAPGRQGVAGRVRRAARSTPTRRRSRPSRRRRCSISSKAARASSRCTAPRTASSTRRSTSIWSARSSSGTARARFRTAIAEPRPSDHEGLRRLRKLGRNLRPHQAQREGPHGAGIPRRGEGEGAVDLGPHAGQGTRLLHGLGTRSSAPGATPAFRIWSSAASAGRRGASQGQCPGLLAPDQSFDRPFPIPEMTPPADRRQAVRVRRRRPEDSQLHARPAMGRAGRSRSARCRSRCRAEESMKHMVVPQGFHVELFAAEAGLGGKPICMNWDERGRLWICRDGRLPQRAAAGGTGPRPHPHLRRHRRRRPGRQVHRLRREAEHPHQHHLRPRRRDRAQRHADGVPQGHRRRRRGRRARGALRQLVAARHARRPQQHAVRPRQLDLGHAGLQQLAAQRLGGETHEFRQGFFRFRIPACRIANEAATTSALRIRDSAIEFIRSTDNNTWGFGMSEEGIIFGSTANRNPSVYMPIPNRYYERVRGWTPSLMLRHDRRHAPVQARHRQGAAGRSPRRLHGRRRACALHGPRLIRSEYWNRTAFVSEPTGHLVGTFVLRRDGSRLPLDELRSTCWPATTNGPRRSWPRSAPTATCGSSTGTTTSCSTIPRRRAFRPARARRTKRTCATRSTAGSIASCMDGSAASKGRSEPLVAGRRHARRSWSRRSSTTTCSGGGMPSGCWSSAASTMSCPPCAELARDPSVDEIGLNVGAIHALWTLHGLGVLDGSHAEATAVAYAALKHPSAGVRRNAVQVLPRTATSVATLVEAGLTQDPDPAGAADGAAGPGRSAAGADAAAEAIVGVPGRSRQRQRSLDSRRRHQCGRQEQRALPTGRCRPRSSQPKSCSTWRPSSPSTMPAADPADSVAEVVARLAEADPQIGRRRDPRPGQGLAGQPAAAARASGSSRTWSSWSNDCRRSGGVCSSSWPRPGAARSSRITSPKLPTRC